MENVSGVMVQVPWVEQRSVLVIRLPCILSVPPVMVPNIFPQKSNRKDIFVIVNLL